MAVFVIVRICPPLVNEFIVKLRTFIFRDLVSVSHFYDKFCLPCVMLFNWKKCLFYLQLLISLSGDVYLNPRPVAPGIFFCVDFVMRLFLMWTKLRAMIMVKNGFMCFVTNI